MTTLAYARFDSTPGSTRDSWERTSRVTPRANLFELGQWIAYRYEIIGALGSGGMGQVFEARDHSLGRRVAIKASWPHVDCGQIVREAQALAVIDHPGIVTVYDVGFEAERGIPYLVMELVHGENLHTHLARRVESGVLLSVDEALAVLVPLADALGALHAAGLAHCDVKTANVMCAPGNRVVLTDFGIFVSEAAGLTRVAGTPEYMAPEMIAGTVELGNVRLVDAYAFGVVAYELLAGHAPFCEASRGGVLGGHLTVPPPPLMEERPDVPPKLWGLIEELLAKDPLDRPQPMESVVWRLSDVLSRTSSVSVRPAR